MTLGDASPTAHPSRSIGRRLPAGAVPAMVAGIAALGFPLAFGSFEAGVLARYVVYGILALSFDLLWGYAGILNFAHVAFFAAGAYAAGLVLLHVASPVSGYLALALAVLVPVVAAACLGLFLFSGRVRGTFLAVATLVVVAISQSLAIAATNVTGGLNGLTGIPSLRLPVPGGAIDLSNPTAAYYCAVVAAVGVLVFTRWLVSSPFGVALRAINANETRATAFGYPAGRLQLLVFVIAAAIAGLAGGLYVPIGFVSPELLGLGLATSLIVWVTIGGRGTLVGAFVGALVVSYLQFGLTESLGDAWYLVAGVVFMGVVLLWPSGAVGLVNRTVRRWRR